MPYEGSIVHTFLLSLSNVSLTKMNYLRIRRRGHPSGSAQGAVVLVSGGLAAGSGKNLLRLVAGVGFTSSPSRNYHLQQRMLFARLRETACCR